MTSSPTVHRTADAPGRRAAVVGFATGFVMAFVATIAALLTPVAEAIYPVLVPASPLLRPVAGAMADWNGLVNMLVAGAVNGSIYALVSGAAAVSIARARRR